MAKKNYYRILFISSAIALGVGIAVALFTAKYEDAKHAIIRGETAEEMFQRGLELQQANKTDEAIASYLAALQQDPHHAPTHYELGWSYWAKEDWANVVKQWSQVADLHASDATFTEYFAQAKSFAQGKTPPLVRVAIGTRVEQSVATATPNTARLALQLKARFQRYNPMPNDAKDLYDTRIRSPKSVAFHPDGKKVYVNALEGANTLVYDRRTYKLTRVIEHRFDAAAGHLFTDAPKTSGWAHFPAKFPVANVNIFTGKPVEQVFNFNGDYLWIPYYRRTFDELSVYPSAVALVDTREDKIVRVFSAGPIPKFVAVSPDHRWLAVTHWGDNTVGLIKTVGPVDQYTHSKLIVVQKRMDTNAIQSTDRDHDCGLCLRGTVFTRDSKYLIVGRMGVSGGLAVIDVHKGSYIGTVFGMPPTPRHLVLSPDGKKLFLSASVSGKVARYTVADIINAAIQHQKELKPELDAEIGAAPRTIALTPDGKYLFAALNLSSKVAVMRADTMQHLLDIPADSYPVGLDISPDGLELWVTAQGRKGYGGNSVMVYAIEKIKAPTTTPTLTDRR
ncbi:MAG: beta-propeller fold lactonase family protein [Gammaproteobacteria bacterium]|nr:beta-propeller fold lactonase family protein [Gammaproteobacteria bacterium]